MAQSPDLSGTVAFVTGATRGVGKGVATALAEVGARVYTTGRSVDTEADRATRRRSESSDGAVLPLRCDHGNDAETASAFRFVIDREGRLDLLVNAAWGGYERMVEDGRFTWSEPAWQQPMWRWDAMFTGGVRALFACSRLSVYPGLVRTELVMQSADLLDLPNSESPEFTGRAVAHLYADGGRLQRSGTVVVAAAYAREIGFTDVDGRSPDPLTLGNV